MTESLYRTCICIGLLIVPIISIIVINKVLQQHKVHALDLFAIPGCELFFCLILIHSTHRI